VDADSADTTLDASIFPVLPQAAQVKPSHRPIMDVMHYCDDTGIGSRIFFSSVCLVVAKACCCTMLGEPSVRGGPFFFRDKSGRSWRANLP